MPSGLVVGIFPGSDAKELESALAAHNIDLSKVKVVRSSADDSDDEPSQLEFVDVMDAVEEMESNSFGDDMTQGVGVWDDTGTNVPGIGGRQQSLESFTHRDDPTRNYLAAYPIPSDEVDNFGDAIAEGRAVVLYSDAGNDEQAIADAFRAAGLRNVRAY